jgi:hypothetical protein
MASEHCRLLHQAGMPLPALQCWYALHLSLNVLSPHLDPFAHPRYRLALCSLDADAPHMHETSVHAKHLVSAPLLQLAVLRALGCCPVQGLACGMLLGRNADSSKRCHGSLRVTKAASLSSSQVLHPPHINLRRPNSDVRSIWCIDIRHLDTITFTYLLLFSLRFSDCI